MVNSPLIRPYFLEGGGIGGVPLGSHDFQCFSLKKINFSNNEVLHRFETTCPYRFVDPMGPDLSLKTSPR